MSRNRIKITKALEKIGFNGPFEFYYWRGDGWYADCEELCHTYIGLNSRDVLRKLKIQTMDDVIRGREKY